MNSYFQRYGFAYRSLLVLLILIGITACSTNHQSPVVKNPENPLIGKIYKVDEGAQAEINRSDLLEEMSNSEVIYLGENHDNKYHHKTQLDVIKALVEKGLRPAIGFEFFSRHQTSHLIRYQNSDDRYHDGNATGSAEKLLRLQLGWESNRDQDWQHLYPILQYARANELSVFGADLSAGMRRQISKLGYAGLTPVEKLLVPASDFQDDNYREFMYQSFIDSHCGWKDEAYLVRLYDAWLSRNEAMAQSIVATYEGLPKQLVIMILGGGHTQYNMAVYERVCHLHPGILQINLRFQEVADESIRPSEYFQPLVIDDTDYGFPYEYIWYTPRVLGRVDPCDSFLKHKEKSLKKE